MRTMNMRLLLAFCLWLTVTGTARAGDVVGQPIAPWEPGTLEIHQISTGRGNAGLYIFPDGTTLLVDTGEQPGNNPRHTPPRPDDTRWAGNGSSATSGTRCATTRSRRWTM